MELPVLHNAHALHLTMSNSWCRLSVDIPPNPLRNTTAFSKQPTDVVPCMLSKLSTFG